MTSTNFNVGFTGETRNSSRVLKPPGGGHSDIFGIREPQGKKETGGRRPQPNQHSSTAIGALFGDRDKQQTAVVEVVKEVAPEEAIVETDEPVKNVNDENVKPIVAPTRVRVPPGGFSSHLW